MLFFLVLLACFLSSVSFLSGCKKAEETKTFRITHFYGEDEDIQEYIDRIERAGTCESISLEDTAIVVEVTESQRQEWMKNAQQTIENTLLCIDGTLGYTIVCENPYTKMEISASSEVNLGSMTGNITLIYYNAEVYQYFSGADDWDVHTVVINSDTGKTIVDCAYPHEPLHIEGGMWEQ